MFGNKFKIFNKLRKIHKVLIKDTKNTINNKWNFTTPVS